jgi:hypothetical protein
MSTINELADKIAALEKGAGKSDKKKGFGTFSNGHKFSAFGGTSTDLTLGSKTSLYASSSVSCGLGFKSDLHAGTTVSYTMGPDWESWQKPGAKLGKAKSFGRGVLRAVASKFDFSTVKSHTFNIATEGSTDLLTKKVFLTKKSFEAYSGYDESTFKGAKGKLTYEAYVKSMERVGWVLIASNLMPTASAIGQSLASMDENGNRNNVYGGVNTAGAINAMLNGLTAIGQVSALLYALMQKDKFKDNIVPKQVIASEENCGIFLGSRHPNPVDAFSSGLSLNKSIRLEVSDDAGAFDSSPLNKDRKNFSLAAGIPKSLLELTNQRIYAGTQNEFKVQVAHGRRSPSIIKITADQDNSKNSGVSVSTDQFEVNCGKTKQRNTSDGFWVVNDDSRYLALVKNGVTLAYEAKKEGKVREVVKSFLSLKDKKTILAHNTNSNILIEDKKIIIKTGSKNIQMGESGVVILGELSVKGSVNARVQKVTLEAPPPPLPAAGDAMPQPRML